MDNLVYWKNKWIEVGNDYILNKNNTNENIEIWDKSSKNYDNLVSFERIEEVINNFESVGYINEESTVLDLGCGTGMYSIPLSGICKKVDALDYSEGMLNELKKKIDLHSIKNIDLINKDWNDIDLRVEKMYKKYDFVICSLNPGCYNPKSLVKMNELSKAYCCYIGTNGVGNNEMLNKADYKILGERVKPCDISNIIYPFNILYFSGYKPQLHYTSCNWTYKNSEEEAVEKLVKRYKDRIDIDNNIKCKIKEFVKENLNDKLFIEKSENTLGILTWSSKINSINY